MKQLDLYFEVPHNSWFVSNLFAAIAEKLQENYSNIKFKIHASNYSTLKENSNIWSPHLFTIKNPENQKYIVTSFWDKSIELFFNIHSDVSKVVQVITSAGLNEEEYNKHKNLYSTHYHLPNFNEIYTPYTYIPYSKDIAEHIETIFNSTHKPLYSDKVVFRGDLYCQRKELASSLFHNNIKIIREKLSPFEYLQEQYQQQLCLSLNGAAEICHRDIELFGLGKAVMRLELNVNFNDPLLPNIHYISLGKSKFPEIPSPAMTNILKDNIINTYTENINNQDFVNFIGKNAREWYMRNCTLLNAATLFMRLVKLDLLF